MKRSDLLYLMRFGIGGYVVNVKNRDWRAEVLSNRVTMEAAHRLANVGWTDAARAASIAVRRAKALGTAALTGIRTDGQYNTAGGRTLIIPDAPSSDVTAGKTIGTPSSGSPMHLHREGEFGIANDGLFECINGQTVRVGKAKYFSINEDGSLSVKPHVYEAWVPLEDKNYSTSHRTTLIDGVPYDLETGYAVVTGVSAGNYDGLIEIPSSTLGVYTEVAPDLKLARRSSSPDFFDEKGTRYTYSGGVYTNTATGRAYKATGASGSSTGITSGGSVSSSTVIPSTDTKTATGTRIVDVPDDSFSEVALGLMLKKARNSPDFVDAKGVRYIYSLGKYINTVTGKVYQATAAVAGVKPEARW
jgi:hypothetical protein